MFTKDLQYRKFCAYGFLKNLKFFEPFFILYLVEAGISFVQIGILFSIRAVAVNLMEIPSGVIADSIGRRRSMIISFISYIGSFLIFFFIPDYFFIIPAMLLFAFGDAFRTGTHKAMILDYLKHMGWEKYRTNYYGNTRSWSQRGSAVSALIAAGLVFYAGNYRSVFLFTLVPYVLELALMLSYPKWLDGKKAADGKNHNNAGSVLRELFTTLKIDKTRISFLNSSVPSGFFEAAKDYIQPILAAFGLSLALFPGIEGEQRTALVTGIIYSIIFLLTSAASLSSASFAARFKSERSCLNATYVIQMILLISAGVIYAFGFSFIPLLVFILFYFLQNLRRPVTVGYLSDQVDDGIMATALSVDSQLKTLWVALLSPVIGLITDNFGLGTALAAVGLSGLAFFPFVRLRGK